MKKEESSHKILVYDLGGGTFDVSILELGDGVFEVLATNGNNKLGGDDFDDALLNFMADSFGKENGIDLRKDNMAMQRLKEAAEKAKERAVNRTDNQCEPAIHYSWRRRTSAHKYGHNKSQFEQLTADLVKKTVEPMKKAMADAGVSNNDLDKVILVGGSTRILR